MSDTMRAVSQHVFGGPEVLELAEVPRPQTGPGEVLVRVRAASVNPVDWKIRSGVAPLFGRPPFVHGFDLSGVVEQVGPGVDRFQPGEEVYGMTGRGAQAEYAAVPAADLAGKPAGIDHEHAAALASVGLTAWQALVDVAGIGPGQRVLVHAAAGGVGHVAVQVAKALGATVIGTARADNHAFLHELGADQVIDYQAQDFTAVVGNLDVVFDLIGGDYGPRSLTVLRPGGLLVTAIIADPGIDAARVEAAGRRLAMVQVHPSGADLEQLNRLVADGRLRVHVDHALALDEVAKAHELSESGRVRGKITLTVAER